MNYEIKEGDCFYMNGKKYIINKEGKAIDSGFSIAEHKNDHSYADIRPKPFLVI